MKYNNKFALLAYKARLLQTFKNYDVQSLKLYKKATNEVFNSCIKSKSKKKKENIKAGL